MTILTVRHITTYRYKQPVCFGEHRMMLRPRESYDQRLLELRLEITPKPTNLRWIRDVFGNHVAIARFASRASADGKRLRCDRRCHKHDVRAQYACQLQSLD
jgi:hypothetical protein